MLGCAVGCGLKPLNTPAKLSVNVSNVLSWVKVEDAKSYKIEVTPVLSEPAGAEEEVKVQEFSSRKTSYSLSKLAEGDYLIKVKAIADGKTFADSEWTEAIAWHRPYDPGCVYTLINNDTEYEITNGKASSGVIRIEDEYNGKPVTAIADGAFKGNGRLEEITILGKNITRIGDNAFYNCSKLRSIQIPESVTYIGSAAFQSCRSLTSVSIPENISAILKNTFAYCRSLEFIKIGNKVTSIDEMAFSDCSALKEVVLPDSVKTIGNSAFAGCKALESAMIGSSIESIGSYVFYRCDELKSITIASCPNLGEIGESAFSECPKLIDVTLSEGVSSIGRGCFYNDVLLEEIKIPSSVSHIGIAAFANTKFYNDAVENNEDLIYADNWLIYCSDSLRSTIQRITPETFKEGIVGIADQVFMDARKLQTARFGESLRHIGNYAFYCSALTEASTETTQSSLYKLEIADMSVETIGEYAFAGCDKLYVVNLGVGERNGAGLKSIGNYAFFNCSKFDNTIIDDEIDTSLIPDSVTHIGTYAFRGTKMWRNAENDKDGDGIVYAGNWVVGFTKSLGTAMLKIDSFHTSGIADYAFYKCTALQSVIGLEKVNNIGRGAFYGCANLAAVSLNANLKVIEDYTFYKCSNLVRASLPISLETVGRSAFYKCITLNQIDFELTKVTEIKPYAFYGCSTLSSIKLGDKMKTIGDYAFYSNSNLENLTITDSVEYLGVESFGKATKLKTLTIGENVKVIDDYAFYDCKKLRELVIPASVEKIGSYAFYNCKALRKLEIGSGVKSIGEYGFYGIEKLRFLFIPENVEEIGRYSFKGGKKLTSVTLPSTLKKMGEHAFFGATGATFYTDAESILGEWHKRWNSSYRFVVWGCELSEDGGYVTSLTIGEKTLTNAYAVGEIAAPVRDGYTFVGWSLTEGGEVDYSAAQLKELTIGTKLYSVWREGVDEEPEEEEEEEDDNSGGTLII